MYSSKNNSKNWFLSNICRPRKFCLMTLLNKYWGIIYHIIQTLKSHARKLFKRLQFLFLVPPSYSSLCSQWAEKVQVEYFILLDKRLPFVLKVLFTRLSLIWAKILKYLIFFFLIWLGDLMTDRQFWCFYICTQKNPILLKSMY